VLHRYATKSDPSRPRNEWCSQSLHARAKETGLLDLYRAFYGPASSIHHLDFAGLAASSDDEHFADMAPSWEHLDTALTAIGSWYRCVVTYDEMGSLGFRDKLEQGPGSSFVQACKRKARTSPR